MASWLTQLRTVLWRNILVKKRCWKRTVLEVFTPVLLVVATVLINLGIHSHTDRQFTEPFPAHDITKAMFAPNHPITASPAVPVTSDIMEQVIKALNVTSLRYYLKDDVISTEADLNYLHKHTITNVAIEFLLKNTSERTAVEGYVIRMPHEIVQHVTSDCSFRENMVMCATTTDGLTRECPGSQPLLSGLLRLQWAVETALIQTFWDPGFKSPGLQVQMLPLPVFRPGATHIQLLFSLSMVIALTPLAYWVTANMVTEKKTWVKVMLKVMGLNDSIFWLSWWLTYMLIVTMTSALAAVVVFASKVLDGSGVGFFFLVMELYGATVLGFSSIISVFFKAPKIAGCTSSVTCVLLGVLYLCISLTRPSTWTSAPHSDDDMTPSIVPFGGQIIFSFLSPTALALGVDRLVFDAEDHVHTDLLGGQFPLLAVVLMLILDIVLYGLLAIYLDTVVPDHYRLSPKAWFCLTPSYWRSKRDDEGSDVLHVDIPRGPHMEPLSDAALESRIIRIRDLSKSFKSGRKEPTFGLNGLNLDVVEGQITCILGHPGSGKTTLINILAGVTPPSSGVAFIQNLNVSSIRDQKDLAPLVTFCPQRDFILGDLTVQEHMVICGRLRGVNPTSLQHQIGSMLCTFHLDMERRRMARELTGCQRRRLSLAMAFLMDTKVILLDHPTLGMEAEERRYFLSLLHTKKEDRVIVFTTTHMDEADYYSDRTMVLSQGRLRCVGSSEFLKKDFNVGYRLNMTVREATNTERLMRTVKSHVRDASLIRCKDYNLIITVPLSQAAKLTALFQQLESSDRGADYLGVTRFGITLTTLEQVFWKLGEEEHNMGLYPNNGSTFSNRSSSLPGYQQPANSYTNRRNTAFSALHQHPSSVNMHGQQGTRTRKLSDAITRYIPHKLKRSSDDSHHSPYSGRRAAKHSVTESSGKASKHRSRSLAFMSAGEGSAARVSEELEAAPVYDGAVLPTSLAERRATVAAFRNFRSLAQQKNLSSVSSLKDSPAIPADPMAKLNMLASYDTIKNSMLDTDDDPAESSSTDGQACDPENASPALPLKMGEVLANLQAPRKGVCLEVVRLLAMLKFRVLVRLSEKRWVVFRLVLAVVLASLAVGTSHAVLPRADLASRQKDRLPLFGIDRLIYRNISGESVDGLLADFSRIGPVIEHTSDFRSLFPHNSSSLQSLLDILESNGDAFKLHYNATCALALPHLISFLGSVKRNSSSSISSINSSSSNISLAPNVSAWLQPWPAVASHENRGVLDWVPVLFLGLALILTTSTYAVGLIGERKDNLRMYLGMTGVSRWMYYATSAVIDVMEFVGPAVLIVLLCAVSRMAVFEARGCVYSLALLVVLYMVAGMLWVYAASFLCRRYTTWLFCLLPVLTLVTIACFALVIFTDNDTEKTATILHYLFTVVWTPYVPFGALHYMAKVGSKEKLTDTHTLYVFKFDSNIDICFIMLSVDIVVLWFVVLILDTLVSPAPTLPRENNTVHHVDPAAACSNDDNIQKEIQRVQDLHKDHSKWPKLVVESARKVYRSRGQELRAVDGVTFSVDQGEVLGLLGPPDAGKSTLLHVLLGLSPLSAGSVYMDSKTKTVMTSGERAEKIGFCPHDDPLWEGLTVDQHVQFVAQLKGLRAADMQSFRHSLYHDLDLSHCQSLKIKELSAGDRRKMSFALSMVGAQTFMLLDEPSDGMDVRARHLYWDAVSYFLKASQRATVINTQSSEEAQRLCTRLAVMVNGQLRCLGTPEELMRQCEQTYRLEVRVGRWDEHQGPQRMDILTLFLQELFPGLHKLEQFQNRVLFEIRTQPVGTRLPLANTFHTLESLKRNLDLEDITFSQTDMEQMFLYLARDQKEGESRFSPLSSAAMGTGGISGTTESGTGKASDVQSPSPMSRSQSVDSPATTDRVGGGSNEEDTAGDIDTAECVVTVHSGKEEERGRMAGEEEGADDGPAALIADDSVELEGMVNPAYTESDEEEGDWLEQTSL
ncbi:hypothetical protein ACOMHN_015288 [Nucella lapillus]